jgi:hypothetical protein
MMTIRIILLLSILIPWSYAIAETLTTDAPVEQKLWEVMLKTIFPVLWTAVGPFFTKGVTYLLLKVMATVPASVQIALSSIFAGAVAGVAGAIPDFPLSVESAINMAMPQGATAQMQAMMNPATVQPKNA